MTQDELPTFSRLVTVRQYRDPVAATVAQSVLDSAEIYSFLMDENLLRINFGYSDAIGGIRLQVAPEDATVAEEILSQPIPESFAVEGVGEYRQPTCPRCGSARIASRLGGSWMCDACEAIWIDDAEE
jgi:hypothetical protein